MHERPGFAAPYMDLGSQLRVGQASPTTGHQPGADDNGDSPSTSLGSPSQPHDSHNDHGHGHDGAGDAKKSRACEACRGLKVRCEPDPDDDAAPCKRCRKADRSCVVTVARRKRQKKTDSRVSALEKKIDALTASLQARAVGGVSAYTTPHAPVMGASSRRAATTPDLQKMTPPESAFPRPWIGLDSPRASLSSAETPAPSHASPKLGSASQDYSSHAAAAAGLKRKATAEGYRTASSSADRTVSSPATAAAAAAAPLGSAAAHWSPFSRGQRPDIIDRGVISPDKAAELFQRYKEHMVRHLPAVVFAPSVSIMELRRSKPYLFLALMAAASSETQSLQRLLQKELMELIADKVVVVGEKNLELVQTLHVAVIWYWPPEHFEELKFYQLVHMSAVMALDIGLGRKGTSRKGNAVGLGLRNSSAGQPDPTSLECRRTWLTCHFLAANTAMSLHRPNLIRWSPFMAQSLDILRTSPDALPTDAYLCHLVWTHRMAEDVGMQLTMDDPDTVLHITDSRTQYVLKGLERDLEKYAATIPREMMQPTLKMGLGNVDLYMHELVLRPEADDDADNLPKDELLSAALIKALSASLSAIDSMLQTFLAMDVSAIRCLPVYTFVRVAYAVVVLMKMYFNASKPSSELARVISRDDMRVAPYLEALLDKFSAAAADDRCRPASKFLRVLVMLRTWFLKHGKGEQHDTASLPPPLPAVDASPQQHPIHANTPLQVLSEVAMGRESSSPLTPRPLYTTSLPNGSPALPVPPPPAASPYFNMPSTDRTPFPPQWPPLPDLQPDITVGFPADFDFDSLGVPLDQSGDMHGGSANMVLNDPLFSDMFQALPDPHLFAF